MDRKDFALLVDFYELTMSNGYFVNKVGEKKVIFDMFFRRIPDDGGFAILAGLAQMMDYIENLSFSEEDIAYLRGKEIFDEGFIDYLKNFKFSCDVYGIKEGTPIFPGEPLVTVKGPLIQAQFIETMVLMSINHQSLIATKANRMVREAKGASVMEFGSRRAHGSDGAILGARAAYIGGCSGTACTLAEKLFDIPAMGTMAHSWVQLFKTEYEAFKSYCEVYPDNAVLLVDTYNVLNQGIPNAIKAFKEIVLPKGFRPKGIRIDSGDIAYLSIKSREMLDAAGFEDCAIIASNALDEHLIRALVTQGARIDTYGVGERLVTSRSEPVFDGVYKLVAVEEEGEMAPRIKVSENVGKITNPCGKQLFRFYDKDNGKALGDIIALEGEVIDDSKPYEFFDPDHTWKRKVVENYRVKSLLKPLFIEGKRVYKSPVVHEIRDFCKEEVNTMWDEILRIENPQKYHVDLSYSLWEIKQQLLAEHHH